MYLVLSPSGPEQLDFLRIVQIDQAKALENVPAYKCAYSLAYFLPHSAFFVQEFVETFLDTRDNAMALAHSRRAIMSPGVYFLRSSTSPHCCRYSFWLRERNGCGHGHSNSGRSMDDNLTQSRRGACNLILSQYLFDIKLECVCSC